MYKAAFYETEITPPLGTTIYGYFSGRVNEGVLTKLYAKEEDLPKLPKGEYYFFELVELH